MKELFPPTSEREVGRLEETLQSLVHDVARTDPDSRHFHLFNPLAAELDRTLSVFERLDTRPWKADVRQTSAVRPAAEAGEEKTEEELIYGLPDAIQLETLREYQVPGHPTGKDGHRADQVRAVEMARGALAVQAGRRFYELSQTGVQAPIKTDTTNGPVGMCLVSDQPGQERLVPRPGVVESEVAAQIDGLELTAAGRGVVEVEVEFTGLATVEDGDNVEDLPYLVRPLKAYDEEGRETSYTVGSGGALSADAGGPLTLYYEALWTKTLEPTRSVRPGEAVTHAADLSPIADYMSDLPGSDRASARQRMDVLAELSLRGLQVRATRGGYVGGTYAGHPIDHVLPGAHYVIAASGPSSGSSELSVVEPESQSVQTFKVSSPVRGVTWTPEGLLAVVTGAPEGPTYKVQAINEIRQGHAGGLGAEPILKNQRG